MKPNHGLTLEKAYERAMNNLDALISNIEHYPGYMGVVSERGPEGPLVTARVLRDLKAARQDMMLEVLS